MSIGLSVIGWPLVLSAALGRKCSMWPTGPSGHCTVNAAR